MDPSAEPAILLVSDTHLRDAAGLPAGVFEAARRADHIVHAGDHSSLEVLHVLRTFAPVTAVAGNVEEPEVVAALPSVARVEVGGIRIGVVHDAGARTGRHERLAARFDDCELRVYGHSHQPEVAELEDGTWVVNPGSPTQRRRAPTHTFAWATVRDGRPCVQLVHLPVVLLLMLSMALAGCGGAREGGEASVVRTQQRAAPDSQDEGSRSVRPRPGKGQLQLQAEHEQMIAAMAPVSTGVNDVAAIVRLRDEGAASPLEVRGRGQAYEASIEGAARALAAVKPTSGEGTALHALLTQLVRQRVRAMDALLAWSGAGESAAAEGLALRASFDAPWLASLGTARVSNNLLHASRVGAGLSPKREDAIR